MQESTAVAESDEADSSLFGTLLQTFRHRA